MSLPYESNATNYAGIQPVDAWINYPFANDGDAASEVYMIRCVCKNDEYEAPLFSDVMDTAANAKLLELPFAADATAYFAGDHSFRSAGGGEMSFIREFAPVPATRTRGIGSVSHGWPEHRAWTSSQDVSDGDSPAIIAGAAPQVATPAYNTYRFYYYTSISSVPKDTIWYPTWASGHPASGSSSGNIVCDFLTSSVLRPATSPSRASYNSSYKNKLYKIIGSNIENWKGNIWMKTTTYGLCQ